MPAATRDRLVAAYRPSRDVSALLRAVLTDPAFPATAGRLVKQPVEWAVGAMRQLGVRPGDLSTQQRRQLLGDLRPRPAPVRAAQRRRLAGRTRRG